MFNFVNTLSTVNKFRRGFLGSLDPKEDPTFLTFSIDFRLDLSLFEDSIGLHQSPLFNEEEGSAFSAMNYLINREFVPEAVRLKKFKDILKYITENAPWYYQSISGLKNLWKANTNMEQNYKGKDAVLTIETLEALDLKISYLADLYRKSIYDGVFMREIIPDNLRYFAMDIYVSEFRNLRTLTETAVFNNIITNKTTEKLATQGLDLLRGASDYFENNASFIRYECRFCEFDFSESMPGQDTYSVHNPEMGANSFKIKVGNFFEKSQFKFYDVLTHESYNKHIYEKLRDPRPITIDDLVGLGVTTLQAGRAIGDFVNNLSDTGVLGRAGGATNSNNNNVRSRRVNSRR